MLDDLTAQELATLGHVLRVTPGNACLTESGKLLGSDQPLVFIRDLEPFESLWNKVAEAVRDRDDMSPFRGRANGGQ